VVKKGEISKAIKILSEVLTELPKNQGE